ncbi:hypothetical protein MASR2M64_11460 [Candidatus Cloacimonadota bacterium]|nr:DNA-processing protein DprA [Candidatus Cloacimonadota bacterium]MDD3234893.1 DNA-processing protein DprA [Candidatus Cloacimonadota bacterium]
MEQNAAYWITIAHIPKWNYAKINNLIKDIYIDNKSTIEDFFMLKADDWRERFKLNETDIESLINVKEQIPNNAFLAESLSNQGFEIIPIISPEYSKTLKENLKLTYSPPVLYVKGNKLLLQESSTAVVGSRAASEVSITFTDNIAKAASKDYKVIVSGFAKGVDKAALDSAIKHKGHSIIVLPQGILTFGSGFKKYYKQVIEGDVLVLSTFHPKVPWKPELAMARNPIIYGLAQNIYVAQSSEKGGTWSGVKDGLRKGRLIYVRNPEIGENVANDLLIKLGAKPVDMHGNEIVNAEDVDSIHHNQSESPNIDQQIQNVIQMKPYTAKEICAKIKCVWSTRKMADYLKQLAYIEVVKVGNSNKYCLKGQEGEQQTLNFD